MHIVPAPRDSAESPVRVISRVQLVARVTGGGVVALVSWYIERNSLSVSPRGILKKCGGGVSGVSGADFRIVPRSTLCAIRRRKRAQRGEV